jgi:5-methylcytosine-specific restriction endonuclease McrA
MATKLSIEQTNVYELHMQLMAKRHDAADATAAWNLEHISYHHDKMARSFGLKGTFTLEEWNDLLHHTGYKCLACGNDETLLVINHIIPMRLGGSNYIDNIQPLCKSCHSKKHGRIKDYRSPETLKNLVRIGLVDLSRMIGR